MRRGRTYQTATSRWAGVGPYYAMFPVEFADQVVQTYTQPGEAIIDPFAGRGTAVFSAAAQRRRAIGIEINPVGYVYAEAKLSPANREEVELRLDELGERAAQFTDDADRLPRFFHRCFSPRVQRFLLAARADLNWRRDKIDRTVMALLLVYLHGKMGAALSNQMRQTKSMSPQYAIRWWRENSSRPPDLDPVEFVKARLAWRYAKGVPEAQCGQMYLGNCLEKLSQIRERVEEGSLTRAKLLFTSPPYYAITNYHYDQWLRLWLLGGPPNALRNGNGLGGKFESRDGYRRLLERVLSETSQLLEEDATVYVRTDAREFTYHTTVEVLRSTFPDKQLDEVRRPMLRLSQTRLFGEVRGQDRVEHNGEVDLILSPR
jgi:DNA methylase